MLTKRAAACGEHVCLPLHRRSGAWFQGSVGCAISAADVCAGAGQGHVLFTRQAGSADPCPLVDFDAGWNAFFAGVYGLPAGVTVAQQFGAPFGALPGGP